MAMAFTGQVGPVAIDRTDENQCQACGDKRLTFEPPSLYCTCCGQRIKRNQVWFFQALCDAHCTACIQDHCLGLFDLHLKFPSHGPDMTMSDKSFGSQHVTSPFTILD